MKGTVPRALVRLLLLAALASLTLLVAFGGSADASGAQRRHRARHHVTHHVTHRRAPTTKHRRVRATRTQTHNRYHASSQTTTVIRASHRRTFGSAAPSIEVGGQPPIQASGTTGVQVDNARPAQAPGPAGLVANVPLTPEIPPLSPRIWRVRVTAGEGTLDPPEIVAEPGQRIAVLFDDHMPGADGLAFDLPGGPRTFSGSVNGGPAQPLTIAVPDRAGRYRYSVGKGNREVSGWLVVNPTAAGSTAPMFGARDMRIVARDFAFNPASPMVLPGERVRITLYNDGDTPHNIVFTFPGSQVTFANPLAPGEMRTVTMTIPAADGRFYFYDPVAGNRDRGMNGTMMIYRPAAAPGGAPYGRR